MTRMIDLPREQLVSMGRHDFVALARNILTSRQVSSYEDDWIRIDGPGKAPNGMTLQVTRQAQDVKDDHPCSHLRVSNPTTMVYGDEDIIRHHGEHVYLVAHMKSLAEAESPSAT